MCNLSVLHAVGACLSRRDLIKAAGLAVGVQTYKCDGTTWAFTGPRATVYALGAVFK